MTAHPRTNIFIGLFIVVFALFVALVWVPLDAETGLVEMVRRQINIGDALAPTVAAFFIGLGRLLLLLFERKDTNQSGLTLASLNFIGLKIVVLVVGFLIMLFAGPIAVSLLGGDVEYRLLRDTAPWKYAGYFLGGTFIISGLIAQAEERFFGRSVLIGICVVVGLIVIYDLPFEDLLLPPNGDFR